jgi:hypothetical protein
MGWFERQLDGQAPEAVEKEHGRYLRAAGVDRAIGVLNGNYGVRRYVIRFGETEGRVRVSEIDTMPLSCGGGPPPPDASGDRINRLEKALTALHRNMSTGPAWDTGAIGVLRNALGTTDLLPLFDEDAAEAELAHLPNPGPPGHPLETPEYHQMVAANEAHVVAIHEETLRRGKAWSEWEISEDDSTLVLSTGGRVTRHRCRTIGTFDPGRHRFEWQVDSPMFDEDVFAWPDFRADLDPVVELGYLTTARLGGGWLFVQTFDDDGSVVLAAVWS